MNLENLSLRELRAVHGQLSGLYLENPELSNLRELLVEIKEKITTDPRYLKGRQYLKEALELSGLDSGHCRPQDYYFAVFTQEIRGYNNKKTGEKIVKLLTCFKFNWWMNGEEYLPSKEQDTGRDFSDNFTKEMNKRWDQLEEYTSNPMELRHQMLKAGLEELPALIPFYEKYCKHISDPKLRSKSYKLVQLEDDLDLED